MTSVQNAQSVVSQFSRTELLSFREWFREFDNDAWDNQIEADAQAGKFDAMAREALAEYHAGNSSEI